MAITLDGTDGVTTTGLTSNGIDDNATSTAVTIDASGNVGIGTASPQSELDIQSASPALHIEETAGNLFVEVGTTASNPYITYSNTSDLRFATSTGANATGFTEHMRINSSGNLLVTATSTASVQSGSVNGQFFVNGQRYSSRISTGTSTHNAFYNGNGQVGSIATNGSSTSYNTSSDYRLKENVVTLDNATDRLNQIPVYRFNFIADSNTTVDGFLAHEVQAIVPEAIHGVKDEVDDEGNPVYQGIDQSKLVPLLVATVKELEARIATLEAN